MFGTCRPRNMLNLSSFQAIRPELSPRKSDVAVFARVSRLRGWQPSRLRRVADAVAQPRAAVAVAQPLIQDSSPDAVTVPEALVIPTSQ